MKALFDSNILIDYLNGYEQARTEIQRYNEAYISPISWMEVMAGTNELNELRVRQFLNRFKQVEIDATVAALAVKNRKANSLKLPDAIIWASAQSINALLVTRNTKDFPADEPSVRCPYIV